MTVLLIDDNDDLRSELATGLRARGWDVETARSGRSGLDLAGRSQPSIVLTELILPDIRGFQFADALRGMVSHEMLVIALTRVPEQLHERARRAGFDHVQPKPVDIDALHERMLSMVPVPLGA